MIEINGKIYSMGYTHGGKFHADDICSAALLRLIDPSFPIQRGFHPPQDETILVFDIGNGEFDHHSEPRECRPNEGVPYAAFGKLWRAVRDQFPLTDEQRDQFDRSICSPMDYADNTGRQNPLSEMLSSLNPAWDEQSTARSDELFFYGVSLVMALISAWLDRAYATNRAATQLDACVESSSDGILVSDHYIPTSGAPASVLFFVCPSQRGGWQAMSLRHFDEETGAVNQILFPEDWRGVSPENLPDGVTFCHAGGFMACFETKAQAVEICKKLALAKR